MRQLYLFYFTGYIGLCLEYFKGVIKLLVFDTDTENAFMMPCIRSVRETDEMGR